MVIKKYVSDTEKDAILLAKNDLGNEAIVMNIRKIQPKGILSVFMKSKVEVTAAIDEGSSSTVTPSLPEKRSLAPNQNTLEALEKAMKHGSLKEENSPYDNVEQIEKKIDHLQNSLQDLIESKIQSHIEGHEGEVFNKDSENKGELAGKQKSTRIESCKKLIKDQLVNAEMISEYADEIIQEIDDNVKSDTSINAMLGIVYQRIILKLGQPSLINVQDSSKTKYIFFIGPTGVGKTTTIAKIVSDLKLNKKAKVAMVTADTYRIAAVEQLKTYANILSIPLRVVYSPQEMQEATHDFEDYDYVLVDTAGRSHLNKEQQKDLMDLLDSVSEKELYLTLSITTKYNDLVELTKVYKKFGDYKLIFTKLDETSCIGNIYNIRRKTGATLSYVTNGQNVPDDFEKLDTQYIAKKLLGGKVNGSSAKS